MRRFCVFIIAIFILSSCATNGEKEEKIPIEYATGVENIKHNLNRERIDLFEAYVSATKILSAQIKNSEDEAKIDETKTYIEELANKIDESAKKLFQDGKYDEALKHVYSLKAIDHFSSISLREIFESYSKLLDSSGDIFTSNSFKEEMADLAIMNNSEVYNFLKYYYTQKSSGFYFYYFDKYSQIYPTLLSQYSDLKKYYDELKNYSNLDFENLMNSIVTVYLDKGMAMKDGRGYFDKSLGTGFFINNDGYILTNHHVIEDHVNRNYKGYSAVTVTMKDDPDTEIPAKVIGYDKVFDIALLKIIKKNKTYLTAGRSDSIRIGERIYAIGSPIGLQYTLTSGIVSSKSRDFFQLGNAFQIDAAVNPGNSGGPLFDERGQVIGIVFAGIPQFQGLNFAIPFQYVFKAIPKLFGGDEVKRAWVGAGIYNNGKNLDVYYILPNGPFDTAGIKVGETIKSIDNIDVRTVEEAQNILAWKRYPSLVNITVGSRSGDRNVIVRIEERPTIPAITAFEKDNQRHLIALFYGIELDYFNKNILSKRYQVTKIYKPVMATQLGIGVGDPIDVYELRYLEKENVVVLSMRFRKQEIGVLERIVTIPIYGDINSIL